MIDDKLTMKVLDLADRIVDSCLLNARQVAMPIIWWTLYPDSAPGKDFGMVIADRLTTYVYGSIWEEDIPPMSVDAEASDDEIVDDAASSFLRRLIGDRVDVVVGSFRPETTIAGIPVVADSKFETFRATAADAPGLKAYVRKRETDVLLTSRQQRQPWTVIPFFPVKHVTYFTGQEDELKPSMEAILDEGIVDVMRNVRFIRLRGTSYAMVAFRSVVKRGDGLFAFVGCHITETVDGLPMCQSMIDPGLSVKHGFIFCGAGVLYVMDCGGEAPVEDLVKL